MLLRAGMGDSTCAPGAYPGETTDHRILRAFSSLFTLASVADPRLLRQNINHYTGARNRHLSMVGLVTVPGLAGKTAPGDFFHRRQGLLPGHSGMIWVSSRILFEPSWSKKQATTTFHIFLVLGLWQLRKSWNSCLAQLHLRGRGWTNFSPLFNDWDDAGPPPTITSSYLEYLESLGDIYLRELLYHREEVLSGLRISFLKA